MHTKEYREAKHEFINCILMSPICFFIPLVLAFKEWLPVMIREKRRESESA